jgi:hypothetical protein
MTTFIKAISASILSAGVLGAAALGLVGAGGGVAGLQTSTTYAAPSR